MIPHPHRSLAAILLAAAALAAGCGSRNEPLLPLETFHWIRQPVSFAPPPARWYRQGDNGSGMLGVRFILENGGGQVMSIGVHRVLAERDRREKIEKLIARRDSLTQREFLRELSLARARTDDAISEREAETARAINEALDQASNEYLAGSMGFAVSYLESALSAAKGYQPTLDELRTSQRLQPERKQHPERWRSGRARDTVLAGQPAFASDDTLVIPREMWATGPRPEQRLLYHEITWVVNGCAFQAVFQGREESLATFHRVVDSIEFPEPAK